MREVGLKSLLKSSIMRAFGTGRMSGSFHADEAKAVIIVDFLRKMLVCRCIFSIPPQVPVPPSNVVELRIIANLDVFSKTLKLLKL